MAKRYSDGAVRYRVRKGKDGTERGHWEGIVKVSDDGGPWKSRCKALKTYPKLAPDGRTIRADILTPTNSRPNQGRDGALAAMNEWRDQMIEEDRLEEQMVERKRYVLGDSTGLGVSSDSTVYEYVKAFVGSRKLKTANNPGGIVQSTLDNYHYSIKNVERGLGKTKLRDLMPADVVAWQKSLEKQGKAGATINKAYWCLKNACEFAVECGDMGADQFAACFPRKRKDPPKASEPDPNPLDASSLALLNMLIDRANDYGDPSAFMVCVELAMLSGMREAEVCGLRWKDVDLVGSGQFPTGSMHVCNVFSRSGGSFVEKEPKTKAGKRHIPLNDDLRALLVARREQQAREMLEEGADLEKSNGAPPLDYYVCGDANGKNYNPTVLSRTWRAFAQGNDLRGIKGRRVKFHDLRHTFATQAIHGGVDVEVVSKILGHSKVSITIDLYADAMPDAKSRGMEAMNGILRTRGAGRWSD